MIPSARKTSMKSGTTISKASIWPPSICTVRERTSGEASESQSTKRRRSLSLLALVPRIAFTSERSISSTLLSLRL
ncbi:hypothetical protein ACFPRL_06450 [Pseudoclavibacter helvolus]